MKTPYWFDKELYKEMIAQSNIGGYEATISATRVMKQRGHLLFKTSMMQDGWEYFPVRTEEGGAPAFKYVCENDFERLCREYRMYSSGAMMGGSGDKITIMFCPHIKRISN